MGGWKASGIRRPINVSQDLCRTVLTPGSSSLGKGEQKPTNAENRAHITLTGRDLSSPCGEYRDLQGVYR